MAPMCLINTKSDTDQFSSPVPIIGLYIAGATLVCVLLMLFDIFSGLRRSVRYIPCRLFSLNSATLSLLGIASKLPVDLTTYMPSAIDQLSKLTGTTMICIAMGFFMPSLGISSETERITNMIALSFLVVTVFVNICIQISTKLIFSFVVEHVLILCFMLLLLVVLWSCTVMEVNDVNDSITESNKTCLKKCKGSLMHRVKLWYIHSSIRNPQLSLSRDVAGATVGVICVLCFVILSQAAFRSLVLNGLEFCKEVSDYGKWPMWMIIITQIVIILIGGLAIAFRWLTLLAHFRPIIPTEIISEPCCDIILQFSVMKIRSIKMSVVVISRFLIEGGMALIFWLAFAILASVPSLFLIAISTFVKKACPLHCQTNQSSEGHNELISSWRRELLSLGLIDHHENNEFLSRLTKACIKDMNKWINENASKRFTSSTSSSSYIFQMLSRHSPSSRQVFLHRFHEIGSSGYRLSCLSLVLLVKVVVVTVPSHLSENLRCTLDEAFEIIYFIDEKLNVGKHEYQRKRELAKLLWKGGDIHLGIKEDHTVNHAQSTLFEAAYNQLKKGGSPIWSEVDNINYFIPELIINTSNEELCDYIEQVFVKMLRWYLQQLPDSIFKHVNESMIEENEERARTVLKLLYKLDPLLEDKVQWIFSEGTDITRFFDPHD